MKWFFLFPFLALSLVAPPSLAGLDLAVVAGPVLANQAITVPAGSTTANETYWSGGVWGNLIFPNSSWGISSGLLYAQLGAKAQSTFNGFQATYDSKTPYLQLPLILEVWPTDWTGMGLGVYGGVPLGQTVASGATTLGSFSSTSPAGADFGLILNGQLKVPVGVVTFLLLNFSYEYGLANTDTGSNNIRNSSLLVQGGVGLGF